MATSVRLQAWNNLALSAPSFVNCSYTEREYKNLVSKLGADPCVAVTPPSFDLAPLLLEVELFNKVKYKESSRLRHNKVFQTIHRIRRCIRVVNALNLKQESEKIIRRILEAQRQGKTVEKKAYFPSREVFEYLLVKAMSVVRVLAQMTSYCQHSFSYCSKYLRIGHLIPTYMTATSIVSRIWTLSKSILIQVHDWYRNIRSVVRCFDKTGISWIDGDVWNGIIPAELYSSLPFDCQPVDYGASSSSSNSAVEERGVVAIPSQSEDEARRSKLSRNTEDVGEVVSRSSLKSAQRKRKRRKSSPKMK
ncbi:Uncharacterised protein g7084 [Pycnogonum litorale]